MQKNLKLNAKGAILIDAESGQGIYLNKMPMIPWYPASVTKIMTMALALEAVDKR
jgi:D-alanyl-D-alanine carboxypeptidase